MLTGLSKSSAVDGGHANRIRSGRDVAARILATPITEKLSKNFKKGCQCSASLRQYRVGSRGQRDHGCEGYPKAGSVA